MNWKVLLLMLVLVFGLSYASCWVCVLPPLVLDVGGQSWLQQAGDQEARQRQEREQRWYTRPDRRRP